jgi:hypothetical protein
MMAARDFPEAALLKFPVRSDLMGWAMTTGEFRAYVDRLLLESNIGLATAPRRSDASGGRPSDLPGPNLQASDDGPFQLALGPKAKAWVLDRMRATGADKRFDRTIGTMTNGAFAPQDIRALEDRVLDKAGVLDVGVLAGVTEGLPVSLSPHQKTVVDRLMGGLGADPLAQRARAAYGKALNGGRIQIRGR